MRFLATHRGTEGLIRGADHAAAGSWPAGDYRLVMNHPDAKAELPIQLD